VLAFTLVNLAARDGNLPALPGTSTAPEPEAEAPADPEAEGEAPPETPVVEEPVAPAPAMGTPVVVLNAAGIGGLAAEQADRLTAAGFTAVTTGNIDATTDDSVVYYASEDQRVTADLVAQTLGVATVTSGAPDGGAGITVVLVTDPDA
jgi:hypothetical protein